MLVLLNVANDYSTDTPPKHREKKIIIIIISGCIDTC